MEMSEKLKQRFCKECGIPINIFKEPYFTSRMELYDKQYNTKAKYDRFKKMLEGYSNEQEYFEDYNTLKDSVIEDIKNSVGYNRFIGVDFNKYGVNNLGITSKDIYKEYNIGKKLMSIDMVKANFTSMRYFDSEIFKGEKTYEDYMRRFTSNEHFINSKYIRQVVFGNCNPRRQVTFEKHLMGKVIEKIVDVVGTGSVIYFTNDEIVVDVTEMAKEDKIKIKGIVETIDINLRIEEFILDKIGNTKGYVKEYKNGKYDFKCVDGLMFPFVLRKYYGEKINEYDKIFMHEGLLAKLIELPDIGGGND